MSLSEVENETQAIEFKQSWRDEYLEWICGMLTHTAERSALVAPPYHLRAYA